MTRPAWPLPNEDELKQQLQDALASTLDEWVERYKFIWQEFGPPVDMLLVGGIPAMFAINELQRSFIQGNYLSCVLVAQIFVEHSLGGSFILAGEDRIAERGFAALINESRNNGHIDDALADRLHELRRMRNPYVHPRAGIQDRSYMRRILERNLDPEALAQADAEEAVRIVVDFLRHGSERSGHTWEPRKTENSNDRFSNDG